MADQLRRLLRLGHGTRFYTIRTYRDDAYIKTLDQAIRDFCEMKADMLERIRAMGFIAPVDADNHPYTALLGG
jgi:hypothetical protein